MAEDQVRGFLEQATQSIQGGMFNQAIDLIDQAIALDPSNAEAHLLRGVALAQTNQPDAATDSFKRAIEIEPNNAKAFFNLAVHQSRMGAKQPALDAARQAIAIDPAHAGARELVGSLERELGFASAPTQASPPVQSPTAENPYANTGQPTAPYYREGYAPSGHTVAWVENMGSTWVTIGWILAISSIVLFVVGLALGFGGAMEAFQNPQAAQARDPFEAFTGWRLAVTLLDLAVRVAGLLWVIFDIIDRRGNWGWLVGFILCCCCVGPTHAIYMLAGRKSAS